VCAGRDVERDDAAIHGIGLTADRRPVMYSAGMHHGVEFVTVMSP